MFVLANDNVTVAPSDSMDKLVECLKERLKNDVVKVSVGESNLLGLYVAMNSKGAVLPNIATEKEIAAFKALGLDVYHSKEKSNAHGNNIALNDFGGIINPHIHQDERKRMEDVLGVELVPMGIAGYVTVGSSCLAGNKGFLLHFAASEDEVNAVAGALKVKGERGTVNMGTGFVALGVIGNRSGYCAGEATSAHEMGRVESALGYL